MKSYICTNCGKECAGDTLFCKYCGTPAPQTQAPAEDPSEKLNALTAQLRDVCDQLIDVSVSSTQRSVLLAQDLEAGKQARSALEQRLKDTEQDADDLRRRLEKADAARAQAEQDLDDLRGELEEVNRQLTAASEHREKLLQDNQRLSRILAALQQSGVQLPDDPEVPPEPAPVPAPDPTPAPEPKTQPAVCPMCGFELEEDAAFCGKCGCSLKEAKV